MDKVTLIRSIQNAGVVGEGGAGFPAHVKYDTQVDTVIANGCECEPLLHTDQYIMKSHASDIIRAMQAVVAATGATRGVIGIKRKYTEIAGIFAKGIEGTGLELAQLDNFYPAGDEQILVHEVTGKSIPPLGLPKDVGAVVANVGTLQTVADAMDGKPLTHKVLTVTGDVAKPSVIRVPLGTSLKECLEFCGGATNSDPVYILGGPMMGRMCDSQAAFENEVITKTSGGLIVLPRGHYLHKQATLDLHTMQRRAATACIQCRMCTELCPRYLIGHSFETHKVMRAFGGGQDVAMGATQAAMCCECGVCELFSCPMGLSPRRINSALKGQFREKGVQYTGPREVRSEQSAMRPYRKIPVPRLASKIGIADYMNIHPEFEGDYKPAQVSLPLRMHIGAPCVPQVKVGDTVTVGQLIGAVPEGALGATVHASIAGTVVEVGNNIVIKGA
ncbi:4Fe-4S dicluster domain-containing protein [Halodesulfovibrio marinisediminis]|uniref:Na+-translocating ferredoxin:NAD+ oxidoreductase RNF, RnfC subunit n=1 Tax=Halodesulfovibrio marinisediminis DSM 17456 TaxID=1121457 RepID=A0A1N6H4D1_9BACT|nr:Na+-translocating ferredoxin:NAD+ oxidoreductase RNF, RnfC subunit [Halodesulfovibrio marinisediminis DSM 17456]